MFKEEFQELINSMFFALLDTDSPEDIFNAVSGPLLALPGIHTVFIQNTGHDCHITNIAGLLKEDDFHPDNTRNICRWVTQEGRSLCIQDTHVDPRMDIKLTDPRVRFMSCWPIRVNGEITNILCLISDRVRDITAAELSVINVVTGWSGCWLSYLRIREEAKQSRRKLLALEEISRVLNSSLDLKTLLNMIIDLSVNLFEVEFSCVYLMDKDRGKLKLKVARGVDEAILKNLEHRFEEDRSFPNVSDFPVTAEGELLGYLTLGDRETAENDRELITTFANLAGVAIRNSLLFAERQRAHWQTVNALSLAIEARDKYMRGHTAKVREFALAIGEKLGLGVAELHDLEIAGVLHDIGKLGVTETILNKYGEFNEREYAEFKRHSVIGAEIVEAIEAFRHVAPAIRHHHEKYDGAGYPDGLTGEEIPLLARIIAVADAFAALTAARPHLPVRTHMEALQIIKNDAGIHFDPGLVEIFEKVVREKYFVRIDRLGAEESAAALQGQGTEDLDLTEREMEILGLIAAGLNNKEISDTLYLSEKTVKTHVSNILRKLNLADRTKAAVFAIKKGLVTWVELE